MVCPKRSLCSVTAFPLLPLSVRSNLAGLSGEATVTSQRPSARAEKGLGGVTTAPGGRPESVSFSLASAEPNRRAGVTPADQGVELASTASFPKAQGSGPQPPQAEREGRGVSSSGSTT